MTALFDFLDRNVEGRSCRPSLLAWQAQSPADREDRPKQRSWWHANANEWHYVAKGRTRVKLFALDKRIATAELAAGDCAYIPRGCGHTVENIGKEDCEVVGVLDSGTYSESTLTDWFAKAPRQLLANNLGLEEKDLLATAKKNESVIVAAT